MKVEQESPLPPVAPGESSPGAYRFYPGWTMLGMAALAQFMSAPGQSYSVAAFKDPMLEGLGISETDFALAYGFATVLSGVCLPFLGRVVDRWGARRVLPAVATVLGGGCLWMAGTSTLLGLYLGFGLVRSLGQGALSLLAVWLVGEWFHKRRGLAAACAGLGGSLSVMTFPILNSLVITHFGWQPAWGVLAVLVWATLVLPVIVLVRDRPEDLGLHPDGIAPATPTPPPAEGPPVAIDPTSHSVGEVLRDPQFWKLLTVPATSGMIATGLVFHQVALLGSRGVAPGWALGLISVQAGVAVVTSLAAGWLTDRIAGRFLLCAAMIFLAASVAVVLVMPSPALAAGYAVLLGLHGSILRSTGNVVWINYYGRTHQGSIRGIAFAVMVLAAALGPLPLALSIDHLGSYNPALIAFLAVPALAAVVVRTARPPRPVLLTS